MPRAKPFHSRIHPAVFFGALCGALLFDGLFSATAQSIVERQWADLVARPSGPEAFRFYLQPTMAAIAAIKDGVKDAKTGRSPYFWTVLHVPEERKARLIEGLKSTGRIILLGIVMDGIYQFVVLKAFYPVEMLVIVLLLAFVPYLLLRGPIARVAQWWLARQSASQTRPRS